MRKILVVLAMAACGGGGGGNPTNQSPVATLVAGDAVTAGQPLAFDASGSADPDGDPLRFSWSFGDGGRGGTAKLAHVFGTAGAYTVTLTVADGRGGVDETTHAVTVAAAPPPTAMVTATVRVSDPNGERVSGATVRVLGGASATTDSAGMATVTIGAGASQVLRIERAGYVRQTQVLTLPEENPFIEVVLYPAASLLTLDDAAAGGMVAGADGATVELPAGGLVDDNGETVSGTVDVAMTPLDVVNAGAAFPGKFEGVDSEGTSGLLLSWGTMDVSFSQGGQHLNLAPGETATIEIPIYAGLAMDGTPVQEGAVFPLWSLDETTGVWIQEGEGTVVASSGSPTGLALRGQVAHFSWWNCDQLGGTHNTQTRCCIDSNFDGQCDGDTICYVRGRTNCAGSYCAANKPATTPIAPPAYSASTVLGAGETAALRMPTAYPVMLEGFADNGTKYGSALILADTEAATLLLHEIDEPLPTQMITIPWDMVYAAAAGKLARFTFDAQAAKVMVFKVERGEGSLLEGVVKLRGPNGEEIETATFAEAPASFTFAAVSAGRYTIEVDSTQGEPGSYRLEVSLAGDAPIVDARVPAAGATGVALGAPIQVTFTRDIKPNSVYAQSFRVVATAGYDVPGARSVAGNVVTFTPTEELGAGLPYRVVLTTAITDTGGTALPAQDEWTFTTADVVGKKSLLSGLGSARSAMAADGSVFVIIRRSTDLVVYRYQPGIGWGMPVALDAPPAPATYQPYTEAIAAAGSGLAVATWQRRNNSTGASSLWSSHYSPSAGWSAPVHIADTGAYLVTSMLAMDAQGRALLTWFGTGAGYTQFAARWTGTAWLEPVMVTELGGYGSLAMNAAGDAVLAVRNTYDGYAHLFDGATGTFAPVKNLGNAQGGIAAAGIDDAGNVFVLWEDGLDHPHVARRLREGDVWEPIHDPVGATTNPNCFPSMAVSPDGSAVVGYCNADATLTPVAERFDGDTWLAPYTLEPVTTPSGVFLGVAAAAGGRFLVTWTRGASATQTSHYRNFTGGAWETGDPKAIPLTYVSDRPVMLAPSGLAMAVWYPGITAIRLQ